MNKEVLKTALFDVEIKSGDININQKGLSYDEAKELVDRTAFFNPDDKKLQEAYKADGDTFGFRGSFQSDFTYQISAYQPKSKGEEKQTCPYRMANPGPWKFDENIDTWDKIGKDRVCSFCGSMHPEELLTIVKKQGFDIIGYTDKNYKLYVDRKEVPNASFGAIKFYTYHFTQEQISQYNELLKKFKKENND